MDTSHGEAGAMGTIGHRPAMPAHRRAMRTVRRGPLRHARRRGHLLCGSLADASARAAALLEQAHVSGCVKAAGFPTVAFKVSRVPRRRVPRGIVLGMHRRGRL
eukprot:6529932-Prymnesium_polylepis.1